MILVAPKEIRPMKLLFLVSVVIIYFQFFYSSEIQGIEINSILKHLKELSKIAKEHNGSRTALTGFNSSSEYVISILKPFYNISKEYFSYKDWVLNSEPRFKSEKREFKFKKDFYILKYSPSLNLKLNLVKKISNYGCSLKDYQKSFKNEIFLIQRGKCKFLKKLNLSILNGASLVIIYDLKKEPFKGTLEYHSIVPVISIGYNLLQEILTSKDFTISIESSIKQISTFNLIVESYKGNSSNAVVLGAHLDSVPYGPGINDNGSGVSFLIEIALYLKNLEIKNKVIFGFWGAEEPGDGLLGSNFYSENNNLTNVQLYLNFDMLASPNFILGIFNGSSSEYKKEECIYIQKVFESCFQRYNYPFHLLPIDGMSDYQPFLEKGIPIGGLDAGAYDFKTKEEFEKFNGVIGIEHDKNYHKETDILENLSIEALQKMSNIGLCGILNFTMKQS